MEANVAYSWHPLTDYEEDPQTLARPDLPQLAGVWTDQREALVDAEALESFNRRLRREWSIETGLLERIYTFDRGVTQMLIERGIDVALIPHDVTGQDPSRVAATIRDHEAVIEGLFDFVRGNRELSVGCICEVHAALTRNQPTFTAVDQFNRTFERELRHGRFKDLPNNPTRPDRSTHEYCPPVHVQSEMDRLVGLHLAHQDVPSEVEAAWLHHRFAQIHPFEDGNGRVARCLATLVFLRAQWFPLTIRDIPNEKKAYIDAVERADHGDLSSLVGVFADAQRRAFVQALGLSGQVLSLTRAEQVIAATRQQLEERDRETRLEWENAKRTVEKLQAVTVERFTDVCAILRTQTAGLLKGAAFKPDSEEGGGEKGHYFRHQIVETAKRIGYFANTSDYHAWTRLVLRSGTTSEVLISFHGIGHGFRGVLAVSACFFRREFTEEKEREVTGLTPLADGVFQVNFRESAASALTRYEPWLEEVLVRGLELWRQTL